MLESCQQCAQGLDMRLDLDQLGINAGCRVLSAQLLQRTVDGADSLCPVHCRALYHDLGTRDRHNACKPCVTYDRRIVHNLEMVRDYAAYRSCPHSNRKILRRGPCHIILRIDRIDIFFFKIKVICVL